MLTFKMTLKKVFAVFVGCSFFLPFFFGCSSHDGEVSCQNPLSRQVLKIIAKKKAERAFLVSRLQTIDLRLASKFKHGEVDLSKLGEVERHQVNAALDKFKEDFRELLFEEPKKLQDNEDFTKVLCSAAVSAKYSTSIDKLGNLVYIVGLTPDYAIYAESTDGGVLYQVVEGSSVRTAKSSKMISALWKEKFQSLESSSDEETFNDSQEAAEE